MATVLIIDDDAAMREALAEASRDFGFEARVAASGPDGIAALEREAVDAVLLDLRMAGMDGLEVLRLIRERPHSPPVTILTAHATATNTIEAMRLGAFDHLTKPIGRDNLSSVLRQMLASRARRPRRGRKQTKTTWLARARRSVACRNKSECSPTAMPQSSLPVKREPAKN